MSTRPDTRTGALRRVAEHLGINPQTLRNWVQQAEVDEGHRPGVSTAEAKRIAELEREVRELRRAIAASIARRQLGNAEVFDEVYSSITASVSRTAARVS